MPGLTERFVQVVTRLESQYGDAPSLLAYRSPFELLIAVILSAQTTDDAVNATLPTLFETYPDAARLAEADPHDVEEIIHSLGFYRQKTRSIIGTAQTLVAEYGGSVPNTMEDLVKLPGVGRKSAGVVLLHIYGVPAIIVDTHFGRVVRRLGFSAEQNPVKLERDVAAVLPREYWNDASMRLNYHGRRFCYARHPDCGGCPVADLCPSAGILP
ncbi:MAG: endonuclease III [Alkalispirochaeta sp.]